MQILIEKEEFDKIIQDAVLKEHQIKSNLIDEMLEEIYNNPKSLTMLRCWSQIGGDTLAEFYDRYIEDCEQS